MFSEVHLSLVPPHTYIFWSPTKIWQIPCTSKYPAQKKRVAGAFRQQLLLLIDHDVE
jgi:hypothetical protein